MDSKSVETAKDYLLYLIDIWDRVPIQLGDTRYKLSEIDGKGEKSRECLLVISQILTLGAAQGWIPVEDSIIVQDDRR